MMCIMFTLLTFSLKDEKKAKYGEKVTEKKYKFTRGADKEYPPLVVGSGPAGLMCALVLSEAGYKPLLIEQGMTWTQEKPKVEDFWKNGILDTRTNVQFGEGGAGTFSDGKLNTGHKKMSDADLFWSSLCVSVRRGDPI